MRINNEGKKFSDLIINKVKVNNNLTWSKKHWKSIEHAYRKSSFFSQFSETMRDLYSHTWEYLLDLNIGIIEKTNDRLGIDNRQNLFASDLDIQGKKTDLLLSILTQVNADTYVSGPAAKDYIKLDKFKEVGIQFEWFEYSHPKYSQIGNDFIPYMSTVDLIFNTGKDALSILREGSKDALIPAKY